MPRIPVPPLPVSGMFGVGKPSGPTSMAVINDMKKSESKKPRSRTLDPIADGVLVVGIGKGTKKLSQFLNCEKEYQTTCLLGCETDTYDSEGARVRIAPWHHVTKEKVESALSQFTGEIRQTPPIFSALKMDGKPLYEYARRGIPLPRPIEARTVKVHSLELLEWKGNDHGYRWPTKTFSKDEKRALEIALRSVDQGVSVEDGMDLKPGTDVPTAFVLKMKVSGGTYVRSIVHDLAHALGSAGHVVTLTRTRQGRFVLDPVDVDLPCVPCTVFEKALVEAGETDADGWTEWER
ncbi:hypothetical protein APHAL10511_005855 [Amanita phalloides]|nr:hypothetical protein APHAL10511_005855 [Amanita phalloides]